MRRKKIVLTHEDKIKALTPPSCGFLKDTNHQRIMPKSQFLKDLEARQIQEVEIALPVNVSKIRR